VTGHANLHNQIRPSKLQMATHKIGSGASFCAAKILNGAMSYMGHGPGGAGDKPGHVRYSAEGGSKSRALAALLPTYAA